jgi:hypothetical protein
VDDERELLVVAMILEWRSAGLSHVEIAALLNKTHQPCRGERWHPSSVCRQYQAHAGKLPRDWLQGVCVQSTK